MYNVKELEYQGIKFKYKCQINLYDIADRGCVGTSIEYNLVHNTVPMKA